MAGRSHNVPGQVITLGKRLANSGEELYRAFLVVESFLERYPLRGIKGAMGTAKDQLDLLGGDTEALAKLEAQVAEHLGFEHVLGCVGQVYPRSLDFEALAALSQVTSGPGNFAKNVRLMTGFELVSEGFKEGQVGSSVMAHKINPRSCERINGLVSVVAGFLAMVTHLLGDQWQEGDVSCSVVRRIAIPGAFLAIDGLLETFLTVLDEFGAYPAVIGRELDRYLPFLSTTQILGGAVSRGMGREDAYAIIQQHAKAVASEMRTLGLAENDLYKRLGENVRFPLYEAEIRSLVGQPVNMTGNADAQITGFCEQVKALVERYPHAVAYTPGEIL